MGERCPWWPNRYRGNAVVVAQMLLISPRWHHQVHPMGVAAFLVAPTSHTGACSKTAVGINGKSIHTMALSPRLHGRRHKRASHSQTAATTANCVSAVGRRSCASSTALGAASKAGLNLAAGGSRGGAKPVLDSLVKALAVAWTRIQPLLGCLWMFLGATLRAVAPSGLELRLGLRLAFAAAIGMVIGLERRTSHRPAGVRTMSLVAIGACMFTLVSQFGFTKADQARVAASVASGVGFIGAGVITTSQKDALRGRQSVDDVEGEVRGLTTASAIWITAGLGMACGAGLFFTATLGSVLTVAILKISRVQESLQMSWFRLRAVLRPRLAQAAAEAAAAATAEAKKKADAKADSDKAKEKEKEKEGEKDTVLDKKKIIAEGEEDEGDSPQAMAAARAIIKAQREEAFRRAISPDDYPGDPLNEVPADYDSEDEDSEDYHFPPIGPPAEEFYDPFYGFVDASDRDAQAVAKAITGEGPKRSPPPPSRKLRRRSRVIPSREYRDYLRNRGGRIAFRARPTAATVSTISDEGAVPDDDSRNSRPSGEPVGLESTNGSSPQPVLKDTTPTTATTTVAGSRWSRSAGVTAAPGNGSLSREGGSGGGGSGGGGSGGGGGGSGGGGGGEGSRREKAGAGVGVGVAGPVAETATTMGYTTTVPPTSRAAEGRPVSEAGAVGVGRGGSDGGGSGGGNGGRVGNTTSAPAPQMRVDAESPAGKVKHPWAKAQDLGDNGPGDQSV